MSCLSYVLRARVGHGDNRGDTRQSTSSFGLWYAVVACMCIVRSSCKVSIYPLDECILRISNQLTLMLVRISCVKGYRDSAEASPPPAAPMYFMHICRSASDIMLSASLGDTHPCVVLCCVVLGVTGKRRYGYQVRGYCIRRTGRDFGGKVAK